MQSASERAAVFETLSGDVLPTIERAERAQGIAARRYAIECVARALLQADPQSVSVDHRARARALGVEEAALASVEDSLPPHAVRVPLVDPGSGQSFVRAFRVEFNPDPSAESTLLGSARRAVEFALERAAVELSPPRALSLYRFVPVRPLALATVEIDGDSLSAAAFVSAISLWAERPVRAGLAVTGAASAYGLVRVGWLEAKIRAAETAGVTTLIVPAQQAGMVGASSIRVLPIASYAELLGCALAESNRNAERAIREARSAFGEGWRGYRWPAIDERLARVAGTLPEGRPDLRVESLARLGAARRHLGDPEGSLRILESALEIAGRHRDAVPDIPLALLWQQRAMTLSKLFRMHDASRAAQRAVRIAERGRLRGELIKGLGCFGLIERARGRWEQARAAFEEALRLTLIHAPDDAARSRVYLLETLGRMGREEEAREHWVAAIDEVERGDARARRSKEAWVRTGWGAALVALEQWSAALEVLDTPPVHESIHDDPLPGLLLRRHLGMAAIHSGASERGLHLLAASPLAYGRALEPGLRAVADVNVLLEIRERDVLGKLDEDSRARGLRAVRALPRYGEAERRLGALRSRVERELETRQSPARAISGLVARCENI